MRRALAWTAGVALCASAAHADLEGELRARLRGRWVVSRAPLVSECTDHFTENTVAGGGVEGTGAVRLEPGELANLDNVSVSFTGKVEVNLTLTEPYRLTWNDGPFTLYDQHRCRVQLRYELPKEVRKDASRVEQALRDQLEVYASEAEARRSSSWNRRRVEPYPADWATTKAAYAQWKERAQREEAARRMTDVVADLQAILRNLPSDPEALKKFADGARSAGYESYSTCEEAMGASVYGGGSPYDDGKRAMHLTAVLRGLQECLRPAS